MTNQAAIIAIAEELAGGGDNLWEHPNNDHDRERYKAQAAKLLAVALPHLAGPQMTPQPEFDVRRGAWKGYFWKGFYNELAHYTETKLAPALGYELFEPGSAGYSADHADYNIGDHSPETLIDEAVNRLQELQDRTKSKAQRAAHLCRWCDAKWRAEACVDGVPSLLMVTLIVCPECGNKRCPKAEWHGYVCSGSNEVHQGRSMEEHLVACADAVSAPSLPV